MTAIAAPPAAKAEFRKVMAERRTKAKNTAEHRYRTIAARKLLWLLRGVPTNTWGT